MDRYLFESPRPLLAIALVAGTILLVCWRLKRTRRTALLLMVGPILAALAFLLDAAVETNREQLQRITRLIVQAAEDENTSAIVNLLSDNLLLDNGFDKEAASRELHRKLSKPMITKNKITNLLVESAQPNDGQVKFAVITTLDPKSSYAVVPLVKTSWLFVYIRENGGQYKLKNLTMIELNNGKPIDIFRYRH